MILFIPIYNYSDVQILMTSIVPALRAEIIHNDKQWEFYHLYL